MSRRLAIGRKGFLIGIVFGLGLLAFEGREAQAGPLTLTVTETGGGGAIPIVDNGGLDTNLTIGIITVDTELLNPSLVGFTFSALGATSNSPGDVTSAELSQTGSVAGSGTISIVATDNDYGLPAGVGALHSSASNTYTNADNGNTTAFTSWHNPSNILGAMETASPTVTLIALSPPNPNSHSEDAADTPIIATPDYGLTNEMVIVLSGAGAQDQFTGSTTVTASAVPEPASAVLMLAAIPLTVLGLIRRRNSRA